MKEYYLPKLLDFVIEHTDYERPPKLPPVFKPKEKYLKRLARGQRETVGAIYIPQTELIFVSEKFDWKEPFWQGVMVHELCHYCQDYNDTYDELGFEGREAEAERIQREYINPMEWRWKNFTEKEMACKHCGEVHMDSDFMDRLQALRDEYGKPMIVSSGYRCPDYNAQISSTGRTGPHTTGKASDILVRGKDAHRLLKLALKHDFTGIGVNQKGEGRFLHLDTLENDRRPWCWSY